jgi:hypothetical protein
VANSQEASVKSCCALLATVLLGTSCAATVPKDWIKVNARNRCSFYAPPATTLTEVPIDAFILGYSAPGLYITVSDRCLAIPTPPGKPVSVSGKPAGISITKFAKKDSMRYTYDGWVCIPGGAQAASRLGVAGNSKKQVLRVLRSMELPARP